MNAALLQLIALIKRFEGCRLLAYLCPAAVWTCGWGSTGPDVKAGVAWTQDYADARMTATAAMFLAAVRRMAPKATDKQLAALADFAYNLGLTRLKASTLLRKFNAGDIAGARIEMRKWIRGGGRVLPGLVARRAVDANLL